MLSVSSIHSASTVMPQLTTSRIVHSDLERPQNLARDMIESYRVPSILDFARVRLHTGYESPNTYFVGRALKDSGNFECDFVKVNFV